MEPKELVAKAENYMHQVMWAHDCYDAYNSIYDCAKEYYDELILSNTFFTITRYSLVSSLMLELCKLYDQREENSIWKLLSYCQNERAMFPKGEYYVLWEKDKTVECFNAFLSAAKETLKALEAPISKIRGRRDQYYAHNDTEFFTREKSLTEKFPISDDEIELLLIFSAGFCNSILGALEDRYIHPRHSDTDDLERLLLLAHRARTQGNNL